MPRAYNFAPGPAMLPESVLRQAQAELLEFGTTGASILEISHRGADFMAVAQKAEADLRTLLAIPDDYAVIFTAGGATTVQALLPLNFAAPGQAADYVVSGHWGKTAIKQAAHCIDARTAASSEAGGFRDVPARSTWQLSKDAAYVHVTANETIHGVEWREIPEVDNAPLVADFSSSIASEPLDISRFGIVYAGAQKNLGPVGITVVIVRRDLLARAGQPRAPIFDYAAQAKAESMLNTPPSWNWYVLGLTVQWMLDEGGVAEFARRNTRKAALLYAAIDGSGGFYRNEVATAARSRMNVPFFLHDAALDKVFLEHARQAGLVALKGHRVLGGMRASLYNAMPEAGVQALVNFMQEFQSAHG
ncbi:MULTISPECIES: 3-phosphoserine/phosphohydroxythreonine transaminase [Thermomonas]|jgi:phosphoserine aminotransferase|uniref:Phosphoserine aminotransferase n=1 Tax=Thermomonas beijingensis TaxID=2872701 RepID=A0ABS7TCW5_9GAMM|nr:MULTISPECIES: 3-phosphoserine/phosphohydroxythreonine transaminase [Thermomonas]MBS0458821.1 3-phosphoserine/phosphohydroxythreonine transaminase [Pseudomonadota bacterium]MDE2380903.1 3-phosphoserine/phosphohydroxythreonine transaminase [Xanthomonadaceae bacterium]MBZ4185705.1 3-phosphoserine/phosphohydroxythreonine transaminase [Thermomonas beijingensis]HOC10609.1 3-phosphoserine/phosphohydroxythreonine transaminase [Thermomonas sp.]HQA01232.1 3-phosphoserine/phosphohydroxythreonine trans